MPELTTRHILKIIPPHGAPIDILCEPGDTLKLQSCILQDGEMMFDGEIKGQDCVVSRLDYTLHFGKKGKIHL